MSRRGVGFGFCALAVISLCSWYLSAAIFGSNVSSWNASLFNAMLQYVGPTLKYLATITLVIGIIYLIWSELEDFGFFKDKVE